VDNNKQIETRDGLTLRGREWPQAPARGTIVLVHGLGEHVGRYAHVAAFFNGRGWRVVGYDHRGHGRSDGGRGRIAGVDDLLVDLAGAIDATRAEHPEGPLALLGHSLGGLSGARFVAGALAPAAPWSRPVDALLLSSPALATAMNPVQKAMLAVLGPLTPDLAVANGLKPEWISRDPGVVAAYEADPLVHDRIAPRLARFVVDGGELVRAVAPRWSVPTLLQYAGADRCVPPAGSAAFAAAAPNGVVAAREWPGLFHEIMNEPEQAEVLSAFADGLDKLLASPPRTPR
jgi:alpha-beta hydrolase superfamily lysophospholipase